ALRHWADRRLRVYRPSLQVAVLGRPRNQRDEMERMGLFWSQNFAGREMTRQRPRIDRNQKVVRHAIGLDLRGPARKARAAVYTRKSTDEGLDMDFNSLDAQRESC